MILILAGVAINLAIDSNGLFSKANEAVCKWNTSVAENDRIIQNILEQMNEISGETVEQCSFALNKTTLALEIVDGVNVQETLVATKENIEGTIIWTSSVPAVATVDSNGKVTTVGAGETIITASCGGYSATCTVTVTTKTTPKVTLSAETGEVEVDKTLVLTASLNVTATQNIVWSSSDNSIATVVGSGANNRTGTVTGVTAGTVTITATYGDKTATCSVTVKAKVALISFIVEGKTYYSPEGWTWRKWCESTEFNVDNFYTNGSFIWKTEADVHDPNLRLSWKNETGNYSMSVNATDTITAGITYTFTGGLSSGGST